MSRVTIQEGHLYLTGRQIKILGKGRKVKIKRNGIVTIICRTLCDAKALKIRKKIAKLKAQLKTINERRPS